MKRTVIGGILSVIGALGIIAVYITASDHMVSGWSTPPGRLITTVAECGMESLLTGSFIIFAVGLIILAIEYFKK